MPSDHKCPVCQATFTRLQHAARHMRSHTGDRPYKCQHRGDWFARRTTTQPSGPPFYQNLLQIANRAGLHVFLEGLVHLRPLDPSWSRQCLGLRDTFLRNRRILRCATNPIFRVFLTTVSLFFIINRW
ncbi:hypothetical protein BJV78DRAFT_371300 [Lactifluus subvellereus]|nr:hypothetical protein BJV78DRAFT_371300 [Lactifluus subvellereus]